MTEVKKSNNRILKAHFIRAIKSRRVLFLGGFLSENENRKVFDRLMKFQDKHKMRLRKKS